MRNVNTKSLQPSSSPYSILATVLALFVLLSSAGIQPLEASGSNKKESRFQLELFSGYSTLSPDDLNLITERDAAVQAFYFDERLQAYYGSGPGSYWSKESSGNYGEIKNGIPFGMRLKYRLSRVLSVSLGLKYLSKKQDSNPSYLYTETPYQGFASTDSKTYDLYRLSVRGFAPMLGLHLEKRLSRRYSLEGYVSAGPVFARCRYATQWRTEITETSGGATTLLYSDSGSLEMEGTGTGIAADVGVRLNISLGKRFGVFVGAAYSYQSANSISGDGKEELIGILTEWNGEWAKRSERLISYWGQKDILFPSNYWPENVGVTGTRAGDFKLDLSGFQLLAGVFIKF